MNGIARPPYLWILCVLAAGALPASADPQNIPVELIFDPPTPEVNTLTLTLAAVVNGTPKDDTQQTTISGNALTSLTSQFVHGTQAALTTGLEFTGGRAALSDMSFVLSYGLLGSIVANSSGIAGTLDTPSPPGSVTGSVFPAGEHLLILNEGTFYAEGTGLVGLLFDPMTFDLTEEPQDVPGQGTGTLTVSPPVIDGGQGTYTVTLEMDVDFDVVVYEDEDAFVTLAGDGTLRGTGQFTRDVAILGDLDGDGAVTSTDIDELYDHIPGSDPAYDVNADSAVDTEDVDTLVRDIFDSEYGDTDLDGDVDVRDYIALKRNFGQPDPGWAGADFNGDDVVDFHDCQIMRHYFNWSSGGGAAAMPEPGTIALLACGAVALARRKRR